MDIGIEPPHDPRTSWDLPAPGSMPVTTRLDEVATRVLAPNASPMTLDGTNTYVLGADGTGEALVVDPGPEDPDHLARVEAVLSERDAAVRAVVVTHHHLDHAAAAAAWGRRFGAPVLAGSVRVADSRDSVVGDGQAIGLSGLEVRVIATPGHCADHVALRLGTGALLTGDHVLGRGTSVVTHPDGDLGDYLTSLRRVLDLGPDALLPGHGPELREDPQAVLRYYEEHRRFRQAQILAALEAGPVTPRGLVERIYVDVPRHLWEAAEASTRSALDLLEQRGRVLQGPSDIVRLAD